MKMKADHLWVCIPAMDEYHWLPGCLDALSDQTVMGFKVVVCVNQPDHWWFDPYQKEVCLRNTDLLAWLLERKHYYPFDLMIIDKTSQGKGWHRGKGGAGMARREATGMALRLSEPSDIIVSADADTLFDTTYLADIMELFSTRNSVRVLSSPYYHPVTGVDSIDLSVLRYEIYLRCYLLNLLHISSPYAFTPLGSAIAIRAQSLSQAKGFPARAVGEDFYLLQKMAKQALIALSLPSRVYPASRLSQRVEFGTGPAIRNGLDQQWDAYPIIHPRHFQKCKELYQLFPVLYHKNVETPADAFLAKQFGELSVWNPLRKNSRSLKTFTAACHQKFDGLRIWQWMRREAAEDHPLDSLKGNVQLFLPDFDMDILKSNIFTDIPMMMKIRDAFVQVEKIARQKHDKAI